MKRALSPRSGRCASPDLCSRVVAGMRCDVRARRHGQDADVRSGPDPGTRTSVKRAGRGSVGRRLSSQPLAAASTDARSRATVDEPPGRAPMWAPIRERRRLGGVRLVSACGLRPPPRNPAGASRTMQAGACSVRACDSVCGIARRRPRCVTVIIASWSCLSSTPAATARPRELPPTSLPESPTPASR